VPTIFAMSAKHPLATWREAQDPPMTQEVLAKRVGTSRWTINSIETGRRMPGRDLIVKIARETGNSVGLEELAA
jgi:DNA-binding XRE family transcriptional regulator